jgi:transcriptional regulator with XRE-family HTH domain
MMTSAQCRAARGLLDWSQQQLADAARVGVVTVRQFEASASQPRSATLDVLRRAIEAAGVIFVEENGEGPGVRLRKKPASAAEITQQIEALDDKIAELPVDGEPSPETGMNRLRKALVKNERTKLKNRRTKIRNKEPK